MKLEFIPLDYDSFDFEGKNYVRIFGRTSSGKRVCVIDTFEPFFYAILKKGLSKKKIDELIKKIEAISFKEGSRECKVEKAEIVEKRFLGENVDAVKIFVNNHKDMAKIVDKIDMKEIDKRREYDISLITRYILERKIVCGKWYEINGEVLHESFEFGGIDRKINTDFVIKLESSKEIENKNFNPKVMAFDIETDEFEVGKGSVLMISVVTNKIKKVFTWKDHNEKLDFVQKFKTEKEMIVEFIKLVKKESPDIITGYYSDGFDFPYLRKRAEKYNLKFDIGLDSSNLKFTGGINARAKIVGIVHVDLLAFIQIAYSQYLQSETLSLNDVAAELLGEKKIEHEFKPQNKMTKSEWERFYEYSLKDSVLTYNLFIKAWPDMLEFSRVMQEPLFDVSRSGMSGNVEDYIIHNLDQYNEIIEKRPSHEEIRTRRGREKYEGAFVLQPVPKLYEKIVMFDFTSYWPSIIASFNLSRSTFLGDKPVKNSIDVEVGKKKFYFSKESGFFPDMLKEIIYLRKKYKKEYQKNPNPILKARSNAFKLLANASYGYQGFFGARYYCPEASAATTAVSREFMKKVIEESKKAGFNPIYSDTDSIALELLGKNKKQALEFLKKINDTLPGIMELELEDFYERGIWVTTRSGEFGAKKKYALINEENKLKIRGFETVRRDWCALARSVQNQVLEMILHNGDEKKAVEYVKDIVKKIKNREVEKKDLIIKTQLKKSLSEYKAVTPHVTIARKMLAKGLPVNQGMLILYFIAEGDKKSLTRDRAVFPEEDKEYDINYYLEKQILPAVENIFQVFDIDVKDFLESEKQKRLF